MNAYIKSFDYIKNNQEELIESDTMALNEDELLRTADLYSFIMFIASTSGILGTRRCNCEQCRRQINLHVPEFSLHVNLQH